MFQTELVVWLQSFESPALTWLLSGVSLLGYTSVYIFLLIVLAFGLRLRAGLAVLVALLLAGILTDALKTSLALPRPGDVDAGVRGLIETQPAPVVEHGGARSFWTLPSAEAIAAVRSRSGASYGFPSGHVSSAAAFLVGAALFFGSRLVLGFAFGWIPLMALSRLYLGRHFLADVLSGIAVGVAAVGAAALLLGTETRADRAKPRVAAWTSLAVVCVILMFFALSTRSVDPGNTGRLVGVVAGYAIVLAAGHPRDDGAIWQRCGRVVIALVLYIGASRMIDLVFESTAWEETRLTSLTTAALLMVVTLVGTVVVSKRLRWYAAPEPGARAKLN